jgi:hypothetical protein
MFKNKRVINTIVSIESSFIGIGYEIPEIALSESTVDITGSFNVLNSCIGEVKAFVLIIQSVSGIQKKDFQNLKNTKILRRCEIFLYSDSIATLLLILRRSSNI